ncbi:MAG: indolepyruvate oxidoreductase subunit beta [Thermoplasmata archaeon]
MKTINVTIVGVGGQGVVSAGIIIGNATTKKNLNTVMSEIHGMAQRGGIVSVDLRIGDVYGPIIPDGSVDLIIGFEALETIRSLKRARNDTVVIMNMEKIIPFTVNMGEGEYPDIEKIIKEKNLKNVVGIDAVSLAKDSGNYQAVNMVMTGAAMASGILPVDEEDIENAIKSIFPEFSWESNLKALRLGMDQYRLIKEAYQ